MGKLPRRNLMTHHYILTLDSGTPRIETVLWLVLAGSITRRSSCCRNLKHDPVQCDT
jgi:hypothetical protein